MEIISLSLKEKKKSRKKRFTNNVNSMDIKYHVHLKNSLDIANMSITNKHDLHGITDRDKSKGT